MPTVDLVFDVESNPPALLGTLMPAREDDEGLVVRYFDSGGNEEEHIAPADCVMVIKVWVPL